MAVDLSEPETIDFGSWDSIPLDDLEEDLLHIQREHFEWFLQKQEDPDTRAEQGFEQALQSTFPIETDEVSLEYLNYEVGEPENTPQECKERDITYSVPIKAQMRMIYKDTGEIIEEKVFLGDYPYMTPSGSFVINGTERVITSQLIRSPGVIYDYDDSKERYTCKIIPYLGTWVTIDIDSRHRMKISIDRQRRVESTAFLRIIPEDPHVEDPEYLMPTNEKIVHHFYDTEKMDVDAERLENEYLAEDIIDEAVLKELEEAEEDGEEEESEIDGEEEARPEVVFHAGNRIDSAMAKEIDDLGYDEIEIVTRGEVFNPVILNTLARDKTHTPEEAFKKLFGLYLYDRVSC